jgi:hypothetical protein
MLAKTQMLTSTAPVASPLSRKAVLVSVNISQWTARRLDKIVTQKVNSEHGASDDAGRYNKLLIEAERLESITKMVSAARALHYKMTKPWADEGARVLPNALFGEFSTKFREIKRDFHQAADDFCRDYPSYIEERRVKLANMFNPADYPAASEIRSKFRLDLHISSLPDAADFRSDLDAETEADIRAEIEASSQQAADNVVKHTHEQIAKVVGHMAEKLAEYTTTLNSNSAWSLFKTNRKNAWCVQSPDGNSRDFKLKSDAIKFMSAQKKKAPDTASRAFFTDSLVENVRELGRLLPSFNMTDDKKLTQITNRIVKELCVEDAETLRKEDNVRVTVQKSAEEILADVSKYLA